MTIKIWDTKVKETDAYNPPGFIAESLSWKNKVNWYQVPYGTTNYTFIGETFIEHSQYCLLLKSFDSPMFARYNNGIPDGTGMGIQTISQNNDWNASKGKDTILQNDANMIIISETNWSESNITKFTIRNNVDFIEVTPGNGLLYRSYIHASPGRMAFAPPNTGTGNDFTIDATVDTSLTEGNPHPYYLPESNNKYGVQSYGNLLYMITSKDMIRSTPHIDTFYSGGAKRLERVFLHNIQIGTTTPSFYVSVINGNLQQNPNISISSGQTYNMGTAPFSASWRITGRINGTYYSTYILGTNLSFISPTNGILQTIYAYPYSVLQNVYNSIGNPVPCQTPQCDYTITVI